MLLIYSSDLHGNINQYRKLFDFAAERKAKAVLLGGDLSPKGPGEFTIEGQRKFFEKFLIPATNEFNMNFGIPVFAMMGNDDWAANESLLKRAGVEFHLMHNKVEKLDGISIAGYPFVPVTPFGIKDWEKWDTLEQDRSDVRLDGFISRNGELQRFRFGEPSEKDTIEHDMKGLAKLSEPAKTVYMMHSPPFNTNLDMISSRAHVGSVAIRNFIEKNQPLITLHGHIHETVEMSGDFVEKMGRTICASSGNFPENEKMAVLAFDPHEPNGIKRTII
ncbi:MAG: metallophosphoesterase [Candidatus Aenigmarchaeota archaeon]|nr:metallophosphoesterase [Candidatus Aenigmarchaeota archaeon]